jgi:hypothetical protein
MKTTTKQTTKRYEDPRIANFSMVDPQTFNQSPEVFASIDELVCTDDEVREVCDSVRDHLH